MGKGRALLLLLGLGGLLLALPDRIRKDHSVKSEDGGSGLPTITRKGAAPSKSDRRVTGPAAHQPSRIITALESADTSEQQRALETLLPDLMKRDMAAAAALAADLPAWARREQALLLVSDAWGKSDPASAHRWASSLKEEERRMCLANICRQVSRQDPMLGIAYAESSPGGSDPELMEQLAAQLLSGSRGAAKDDAIAWIKNRKDPQESDRFFAAGVRALAANSPEEAARIAVDYMFSGPMQEEAVISALHQWVLRDRDAAAAWVALFPEGPLRERAEGELFGIN
jgi:hypothetical protein